MTILTDEEKLVLLALARHLKREKEAIFLQLDEVETSYRIVCKEYYAIDRSLRTRKR